ncbi:EamA family transporter, partial [archaeon]|nr:EamA family transporter [archaeon]
SRDMYAANFFIIAGVLLLTSPWFFKLELSQTALLLLACVYAIDGIANFFFFKTFEKTEASLATPLLSLAPAFTFFFAAILINEIVDLSKIVVSAAIILLVIFFSLLNSDLNKFKTRTLKPAIIASVLFGLSAVPSKALLTGGMINAPTLYLFRAALLGLAGVLAFGNTIGSLSVKKYWLITIRSFFVIGQWLFLYMALTGGGAGISLTLANMTPVFVFILGIFVLKEKKTWQKVATAGLALVLSLSLL